MSILAASHIHLVVAVSSHLFSIIPSVPLGLIVGGVLGGVLALVIIGVLVLVVVVVCRRNTGPGRSSICNIMGL